MIETRNEEAGFIEFLNDDVTTIVREIDGPCAILFDMSTRQVVGYRVYDPASKPVAGVEVKPLEWEPMGLVGSDIEASTPFGQYVIAPDRFAESKTWNLWIPNQPDEGLHDSSFSSENEAKAAAEADYRQRITSALLPKATAPVVSEPVAWRCEDLILPNVSVIDDWEHAQARMRQPKAWRVTPLYASPQPEVVITEEMVERAARAQCKHGGFDPDEIMANDGPRWRYYSPGSRAALTAALKES